MKKPTLPQLCLVEWLYENRFRAFITDSTPVYEGFECHVLTDEKDAEGRMVVKSYSAYDHEGESAALTARFGGRRNFDMTFLVQNGILNRGASLYNTGKSKSFSKFIEQFSFGTERHWDYKSFYHTLNRETDVEWWEKTGRALLDKERAKIARERSEAARIVVVGRVMPIKPELPAALIKKIPDGFQLPIPNRSGLRPQAYGTVVKETEKRLYLENVVQMMPLGTYDRANVLQGQRGLGTFVEREHVILDNASVDVAEKLYALDMEYQEDMNRIATDFAERMLPIVQNMADRMAQKDSERDDVMRETIDEFVRGHQQKPSPKGKR